MYGRKCILCHLTGNTTSSMPRFSFYPNNIAVLFCFGFALFLFCVGFFLGGLLLFFFRVETAKAEGRSKGAGR